LRNSTDRILTTHTGSLPRPPALTQLFLLLSRREPVDDAALKREVEAATRHVVARQREVAIDVANDGEQSRESFITYVQHRLSGYGGESNRPVPRDIITFPTFMQAKAPEFSKPSVTLMRAPKAVGEVRHVSLGPLNDE
jgi:5-methyltetrahydropteroyltriglutamate--homocysteine methyltransferase